MKKLTLKIGILRVIAVCAVVLFIQTNASAQNFPCGSQQLDDCNCDGVGTLVADSEPCAFNSAQNQLYVLVDESNAVINSDADDGLIDQVNSVGVFPSVPTGDYVMYAVSYNLDDANTIESLLSYDSPIDALLDSGVEGPAGTWTSPAFTAVASALSTVNGPSCGCAVYTIGNYVWADLNNNGRQDTGEWGIPGVVINLYDTDPTADGGAVDPIATTTTNAYGYYGFVIEQDGQYWLGYDETTLPAQLSFFDTPKDAGNDALDNDFNVNGFTDAFIVDASTSNISLDLGLFTDGLSGGPLATELIAFNGQVLKDGNELTWKTASEINNDYFTIERSNDNNEFKSIGTVQGAANSSVTRHYAFLDTEAPLGISRYRLLDTDFEGTTKVISDIITLRKTLNEFVITNVYPIPTDNLINVAFNSVDNGDITVKVFDISGKQLALKEIGAAVGINTLTLEVKSYPVGTYFIAVSNGDQQLVTKFVKE